MSNKTDAKKLKAPLSVTPSLKPGAPKFDTYSDFVTYIIGRKCGGCNKALLQSSKEAATLFESWLDKTPISSHIQCKNCSKTTCIACLGRSGPLISHATGVVEISWCCSRGRLFLLWVMLCGFDQVYCDRQRREASTSGQAGFKTAGSGVGYGAHEDPWYDNSGRIIQAAPVNDGKKELANTAERNSDHFDQAIFSALATLCPSPHHDRGSSSFDVDPPRAVVSMLVHSKILSRAAELLRNDSLENATKRKDLYTALISFLKRVGVHDVSKHDVIFSERLVLAPDNSLLILSFKGPPPRAMDKASSLATGLRRLNIQSDTMMRGALNNRREFQDNTGQDMLWLCREISDLSTHLKIEEWAAKQSDDITEQSLESAVVEVPDQEFWKTYRFAPQAQALQHSPAGRIRRLITEITTLKTGLSAGIYVKHAMSRLDCMSILIVGPRDTPYENGLYEFDLFCGANFPYEPPEVFCRYPQTCYFEVNPNLHRSGKVCLSLLGTWMAGAKGEEWQPGKSTILQVLISIQAMILCEDPELNEPSIVPRHPSSNPNSVSVFNKMIRGIAVKYFMLYYAQNIPTLWKDKAEQHFRTNGNRCLQVAEKWAEEHHWEQNNGFHGHRQDDKYVQYAQMSLLDRLTRHLPLGAKEGAMDIMDIAPILPRLQAALASYGTTYVPKKIVQGRPERNASPYNHRGPFDGYGGFPGRGGSAGRW